MQNNKSEKIIIRHALDNDLESASELSAFVFKKLREVYRPSKIAIKRKKKIKETLKRLVAAIDNKIVGTVEYRLEDETLHFFSLATHPDFRKMGIARALINELEAISKTNALSKISLYTIKETGNVEIFNKLGFKTVSEEVASDLESDKYTQLIEVRMEKILGDC